MLVIFSRLANVCILSSNGFSGDLLDWTLTLLWLDSQSTLTELSLYFDWTLTLLWLDSHSTLTELSLYFDWTLTLLWLNVCDLHHLRQFVFQCFMTLTYFISEYTKNKNIKRNCLKNTSYIWINMVDQWMNETMTFYHLIQLKYSFHGLLLLAQVVTLLST